MLRALEANRHVDLGEARTPYVTTIVMNQARNHVRNAHRRGEVLTSFDAEELRDECPSPEDLLRRQQREALMRSLIQNVPPRYREILIKHDLEQIPLADIAAELGLKLETVKTQHRRAMEHLEAAKRRWMARQRSRGWDEEACIPVAFDLRRCVAWARKLGRLGIEFAVHGALIVLTGAGIVMLPGPSSPTPWRRPAVVSASATVLPAQEIVPPAQEIVPPAQEIVLPANQGDQRAAGTHAAQQSAPHEDQGAARAEVARDSTPASSMAPARRTWSPGRALRSAASERERLLVDQARRAVEDHGAVADAEARQWLEMHAREFPQGELAAEREALLMQVR